MTKRWFAAFAVAASISLVGLSACTDNGESAGKDKSGTKTTQDTSNGTGGTSSNTEAGQKGIDVMPVPIVGEATPPVSMDQEGAFGNGVTVRITGTQNTTVEAQMPGETSGPAVAVSLEITNGSEESIGLSNVIVDLTDAEGGSFNQVDSAEETKPFAGQLEAGATTSATLVFRAELQKGSSQYLTVKYSTEIPTVVFAGRITND